MNKKLLRKLNNHRGFSLTELLACTLIMLLATSILTGTIALASRNYDRQIRKSKADILCESLSYALREKLSYVYKFDLSKNQFYSTSADLGYYPFSIETESVSSPKAHDELVLKYYTDSGGSAIYHLINSASYIDGDFSVDFHREDISADNVHFDVTIKIKDSRNNEVLSETRFVVDPFITDVPDVQ